MSATALPEGWTLQTSASGVEHAVTPAGRCVTCGRDHQDWPHERAAAGAEPATVDADLAELRRLAGEWSR